MYLAPRILNRLATARELIRGLIVTADPSSARSTPPSAYPDRDALEAGERLATFAASADPPLIPLELTLQSRRILDAIDQLIRSHNLEQESKR